MRLVACAGLFLLPAVAQQEIDERFDHGVVLYEQGNYDAAGEVFDGLLPKLAEEDSRRNRALRFLGEIARQGGRYDEAVRRTDEAIEAARTTSDSLGEAEALNTRGLARAALGHFDQAVTDLRASLVLHRERGDAQQEAARLSNLGGVLQMHDRYFEAQQYYEQALELTEQSASASWAAARRTILRHNLATLYQRVGRYERALDLYAGIAAGENLTPRERARLFANMGALYRRLGDPYKAVEIYSKAESLAVAEQDLPLRVGVLTNRAIALALDLHRLAEAESTFDEVIRLAEELGDRRQQVHGLLYRAETRRRSQRLEGAEEDFEQAHAQAESLGLIEERWKALYGLGRIAEARGDAERAEEQYRAAILWIESLRSRLEADTLRRELLADRNEPYNALIELLLRSPRADPECGDIAFCSEVLSLVSLGRFRNLRDQERNQRLSPNQDLQQRREELHAAWKSRLAASLGERANLDARIETLEREYEAAERRLGERGSEVAAPGGITDVQRNLAPSSVLLVFWTGEDSLLRMWITAEGAGYRFGEFSRSSRRLVGEYSEAISVPAGDWRGLAAQLGKLLLSDITAVSDGRHSSLLVFPDAALHGAPLEALVVPGSDALVLEHWSVTDVLLPQSTMSKPGIWATPWSSSLVAFAYSGSGAAGGLPNLEYASREVETIAGQLPGESHLYVDESARREAFQAELRDPPPVWHFATHAVLHEERPELSRILLAPNEPGAGPDYLFLGEVEDLRLQGVRLAVLSACETELGPRVAGEGVVNLSRAFLSAGAESVIAGLWRVPDRETAALMEQLYFELGHGKSRSEALRRAKLRLAAGESTAHPYYWAGFRLSSLTLGPVVRPIPWLGILIALAAAMALIAALSTVHRRRA